MPIESVGGQALRKPARANQLHRAWGRFGLRRLGKIDAASSIHIYRDALVCEEAGKVRGIVGAAYLVTPENLAPQGEYRDTGMPARLFHPTFRRDFKFGAVSLRPGMNEDELRRALRLIVNDAAAEVASD